MEVEINSWEELKQPIRSALPVQHAITSEEVYLVATSIMNYLKRKRVESLKSRVVQFIATDLEKNELRKLERE